MDDLHHLLARGQAPEDVRADRALAHPADEVLHDLEVDVGLEQREADLTHRLGDHVVIEASALAQVAERALKPVGKRVEHGLAVY